MSIPWLYTFVRDRTGQSTTIGIVLVIGITMVGSGLVLALGTDAINDTEQSTAISQAEHGMTRLDSQTAMVGLGQSSVQQMDFGPSGKGQYQTSNDDGWIRIEHRNHSDNHDEVLYNATLGSVRYVNGETTIAYQGGGVWQQTDNGTTVVSPPEFHYRGATMTFPVIRVVNTDSASGAVTASVQRASPVRRIYPNASSTYAATGDGYRNPVFNGTVVVTVHSEFYQGWAQYFRTRTEGRVSVNHANQTASVELISAGRSIGDFSLANAMDADGLQVRAQSPGHSVSELTADFVEDHGTVNNMYFSFFAEEGPHRVEMVVHVKGGTKCNSGLDPDDELAVYYFYRNTDTGGQHEWSNTSLPAASGPFWVECDGNQATIHANFTSNVTLTYGNVSINDQGTYYDWRGNATPHADFNHTQDGEPTRYYSSQLPSSEETWTLTRHYIALLGPRFQFRADMGTGNRASPQIDVGASRGTFEYDTGAGGAYITYIHVTENEVEVDLD